MRRRDVQLPQMALAARACPADPVGPACDRVRGGSVRLPAVLVRAVQRGPETFAVPRARSTALASTPMADVLVVGCGLIGTSVALALRGVADVMVHDEAPAVAATAVARGGGRVWDGTERADLVVVAVPPSATAPLLTEIQLMNVGQSYTHVASVQSQVQRELEVLGCDLTTIVGGHPLAGRELSGPGAATGDLFVGRPWAVCGSSYSSGLAAGAVHDLATACGALPIELDAEAHDSAVALLSHLPQVVASALAGLLVPGAAQPPVPTALSGPGLADTTRLAASDPALWTEILTLNAPHVAPAIRRLVEQLDQLAGSLEDSAADSAASEPAVRPQPGLVARLDGTSPSTEAVREFLDRGTRGRALVPVKRGELSEAFGPVRVSVDDQPGRLAALLTAAGGAGVNVEDVRVEHVPGREQGVIELLVDMAAVDQLAHALRAGHWHVLGSS